MTERHSIADARRHLPALVRNAENGKAVELTRRGEPVAKLVRCNRAGKRRPDVLKGTLAVPDSFFDPLPEEELRRWEGR